ncbi:MAG: S8 family serine peptidase [Chloroflexi bacterium]|nr:S8 family serine peptidase [Chloroflexota bacterium]
MRRILLVCISFILGLAGIFVLFRINAKANNAVYQPTTQSNKAHLEASPVIHPALLRAIQENPDAEMFDIIIEWQREDEAILASGSDVTGGQKITHREQLVTQLAAETTRQSKSILMQLEQAERRGTAGNIRSFWVSPIIALKASPEMIHDVLKWEKVVQIRLDEKLTLQDTEFQLEEASDSVTSDPYNLTLINALSIEQSFGLDGSSVVVANLDTGVDWMHPALIKKYRGYNPKGASVHFGNWYVATNEAYVYPGDGNGHGTHTMGTILGDDGAGNRIGVAPGAKWIAVKLFTNQGYTYESWIHAAFQWILAPEGNPSLAPDVINNSWGSDISGDTRYRADLAAIRAAGILAVFSNGNNGPDPATVSSPGSYPESLAVGAVDQNKVVASFSSRGPSPWGEIKPELVAPGVQIRSSYPGGGYAYSNGTSMAAPHVCGVAALLLQAKPDLTPNELEYVLLSSAEPLDSVIPNNNTGWGLVDAYNAAMLVTTRGELTGRLVKLDGSGIVNGVITAVRRDGEITVTATSNISGSFSMPLLPGLYDVTGNAFGYYPETIYGISIFTDVQTQSNITLTAQSVGQVYGWITDQVSGIPLSATLTVLNTPIQTQTDPDIGIFDLTLPEGDWNVRIFAESHRLGHITPTITAGTAIQTDATLKPGPNILLIDSGAWYYESQIHYYEEALEALDYPYTLLPIRQFSPNDDRPTNDTLTPYDVVVWSAPQDSPGLINNALVISSYLSSGGSFLISGQDVAYWDAGGESFPGVQSYLYDKMGIQFSKEGIQNELSGEGILSSTSLSVNTSDSAQQQTAPDSVVIKDSILTQPILRYSDQTIAGITAGTCTPYKAAWLGFGLEGVGPSSARLSVLQNILEWFEQPPDDYGLQVKSNSQKLIGEPGSQVSQTLQLISTGVQPDTYHIELLDGDWQTRFILSDGQQFLTQTEITLPGCSLTTITPTISIPNNLLRNTIEQFPIQITSLHAPQISHTLTITAKTPAPVLIVDDERWYNYQHRYTETLETLELPYDLLETGGNAGPSISTLSYYPLTLWTTGYDWYLPLAKQDEQNLSSYLDRGGRLLLTSQDLLDVNGVDIFIRDRLGVANASLTITSTEVMATYHNPLNIHPIPWDLDFPFRNWSDRIVPQNPNSAILQDQHQYTIGIIQPSTDWRTAFFSFPLETLSNEALYSILNRYILWLSPFGESRLMAPEAAAEGSQIPITLTLGLATNQQMTGVSAFLPLLPETEVISGSVTGPWSYNPISDTLVWNGNLIPGYPLSMGAMLQLSTDIADGTILPLTAQFFDQKGLVVVNEAPIQVDVPWLTLEKAVNRQEAALNSELFYTITCTNTGVVNADTIITETLPIGLATSSSWVTASLGTISENTSGFIWHGSIPTDQQVTITYHGRVNLSAPGSILISRTDLTYPFGRRLAWANVVVPAKYYFPIVARH